MYILNTTLKVNTSIYAFRINFKFNEISEYRLEIPELVYIIYKITKIS